MDGKSYPFPMWHPGLPINDNPKAGDLNPAYPNTKKQEAAFSADGYTEVYANIAKQDWPRAAYNKDGDMKAAESPEHLKRLETQGYTLKPVAKKPAPTPRHALDKGHVAVDAVASDDGGRVEELEERISGLETSLEEIRTEQAASKTALEQILEAVTKGKHNKDKAS